MAMTAAGQSALNVPGLDTVIIYDARYGNVVERGRNVLHRLYLGANEILQMKRRLEQILAERTGQPIDRVRRDTDRDRWFGAEEAKQYGLIDEVIRGPALRPA